MKILQIISKAIVRNIKAYLTLLTAGRFFKRTVPWGTLADFLRIVPSRPAMLDKFQPISGKKFDNFHNNIKREVRALPTSNSLLIFFLAIKLSFTDNKQINVTLTMSTISAVHICAEMPAYSPQYFFSFVVIFPIRYFTHS